MSKNYKSDNMILEITNVYNTENKSLEELKIIFNKKLLNMIYNLEKASFFNEIYVEKCYNIYGKNIDHYS